MTQYVYSCTSIRFPPFSISDLWLLIRNTYVRFCRTYQRPWDHNNWCFAGFFLLWVARTRTRLTLIAFCSQEAEEGWWRKRSDKHRVMFLWSDSTLNYCLFPFEWTQNTQPSRNVWMLIHQQWSCSTRIGYFLFSGLDWGCRRIRSQSSQQPRPNASPKNGACLERYGFRKDLMLVPASAKRKVQIRVATLISAWARCRKYSAFDRSIYWCSSRLDEWRCEWLLPCRGFHHGTHEKPSWRTKMDKGGRDARPEKRNDAWSSCKTSSVSRVFHRHCFNSVETFVSNQLYLRAW